MSSHSTKGRVKEQSQSRSGQWPYYQLYPEVMEALMAKQLDQYQEEQGLVHQGVHGFRKGRGTGTAMLEVWEFVLKRTAKEEMVALNFLFSVRWIRHTVAH